MKIISVVNSRKLLSRYQGRIQVSHKHIRKHFLVLIPFVI